MGLAAAYVLVLEADRAQSLARCISHGEVFAQPVPDFAHGRTALLVCFVVIDGRLTHIARGKRGLRAGTELRRLNVLEPEAVTVPIDVDRLISDVPARYRLAVTSRLQSGGVLPHRSSEVLAEVVRAASNDASRLLDRLSASRRAQIEGLSLAARKALAFQKEAVANAMLFGGLDTASLQAWSPTSGAERASFLDGLPEARLREDPMVINDMLNVPGFDLVRTMPYGAAVFEQQSVRLTVIMTNRQPLEEQLGTDLIYYNEMFRAFVMVQYKAMDQGEDEDRPGFRVPNAQLDAEIGRMDRAITELGTHGMDDGAQSYRLCTNPFFIKLISRLVLSPDESRMLSGMYFPLDYWRRLAVDEATLGPRGGRRVTFDNAGRWLDARHFATLVGGGWLGTNVKQSDSLTAAIRASIESGRALALAARSETSSGDAETEDGLEDAPLPPE